MLVLGKVALVVMGTGLSEGLMAMGWPQRGGLGHLGEETAWPALCEGAATYRVLGLGRGWRRAAEGSGKRGAWNSEQWRQAEGED